jgi:hypothetical protein
MLSGLASAAWMLSGVLIAVGLVAGSQLIELGRWGHLASLALTALWTYRVCSNLKPLGVSDPKYSATWIAGCYFLPVVTFFVPLLGLLEVTTRISRLQTEMRVQP